MWWIGVNQPESWTRVGVLWCRCAALPASGSMHSHKSSHGSEDTFKSNTEAGGILPPPLLSGPAAAGGLSDNVASHSRSGLASATWCHHHTVTKLSGGGALGSRTLLFLFLLLFPFACRQDCKHIGGSWTKWKENLGDQQDEKYL